MGNDDDEEDQDGVEEKSSDKEENIGFTFDPNLKKLLFPLPQCH